MIRFNSDYTEGCHPAILERLAETNMEQTPGYGVDEHCKHAAELIKEACSAPNADVHFLVGGTQTNSVVISTMLKDYEGVIAANTGHINTHEAGAIEFTGHKVLAVEQKNGKIEAETLSKYLADFYADENHEHAVIPGLVYISYPTEYGTLYSKAELKAIKEVCEKYSVPLYLDGARLGYGLMSKECDMTLKDIAMLTDVFYIGGTKMGALIGEAVVFTKNNRPDHFITSVKKRGALLAKGWIVGVQFDTFFTDGLYFKTAKHALELAELLRDIFIKKGYRLFIESPTNQQFVIMPNDKTAYLKDKAASCFWEKYGEDHTVLRFATSWSTKEEDVLMLEELL